MRTPPIPRVASLGLRKQRGGQHSEWPEWERRDSSRNKGDVVEECIAEIKDGIADTTTGIGRLPHLRLSLMALFEPSKPPSGAGYHVAG